MAPQDWLLIISSGFTSVLPGVLGMAGGLLLLRHVRWPVVLAHVGGAAVAFVVARRIGFVPDEALLLGAVFLTQGVYLLTTR